MMFKAKWARTGRANPLGDALNPFVTRSSGDEAMRTNQIPVNVSNIGLAAFFISLAVGAAGSVAVQHPAPVIGCGVVGLYLLFAIKVADQ